MLYYFFFFFKQKTAYEIRKGDWSSDVCSSDLCLMVDHEAAVHDAGNARRPCSCPGRVVDHAHLQPDQPGGRIHADGLVYDRPDVLAAPKHVHHVDRLVRRGGGEGGVALLPQDCGVARIHGDDAVARALQVACDRVARARRLGRQPHDGDRARRTENVAQRRRGHASGRWTCGVPLTARPTSTIPVRRAIVTARVDGTLGVATHASPARAALYASSAEIRPVTSSPRPTISTRAMTASPTTLSTALCRPMSSA